MSNNSSNQSSQSPTTAILIGMSMIMFFCTVLWMAARRQVANIYGTIRSFELPIIWEYLPFSGNFQREVLQAGHSPQFSTIYLHSTYIGMFFLAMIAVVFLLALIRLEKFGITKHLDIKSQQGMSSDSVMDMYAEMEPSVRFFKDYPLLELSTSRGDGRQPMRAMEVIEDAKSLIGIVEDYEHGEMPRLEIDNQRMKDWYSNRMGPENPFNKFDIPSLETAPAIHEAIDELPWTVVLILYPSIWKKHSFLIDSKKGFDATVDLVDDFIAKVWTELNTFKAREGDRLVLGFDDADQRAIQNSLFLERKGKKKKKGKKGADTPGLMTIGELLATEGSEMQVVKEATEGLKRILTRHLGRDTGEYPLREGKNGLIEYGSTAGPASEQAFMEATAKKLSRAASVLAKETLFGHNYQYGLVGAALEAVRKTGIMPALQFRWLRFYDKPFWYFVQNLGMPSAFPENAGSFEHYTAERIAKTKLSRPYIETAINGLRLEAEKYLVDEEKTRIKEKYGVKAVKHAVSGLTAMDTLEKALRAGSAGKPISHPGHIAAAVSADEPAPEPTTNVVATAIVDDAEVVEDEAETPEPDMLQDAKTGLGKFF